MRSNCGAHSTFNVPGSGGAKLNAWHVATELALPAKYRENASFAHNYCENRLISKILTVLESACLVPKLVKLSRYYMMYIARGTVAKVFATEPALPVKHCENASFAYNYCVNRPISIVLTALESTYLVPKLVKLS